MKNITILGSTGSIGKSTLEVVRYNKDRFNVAGLTSHTNINLFKEQIHEFKPDVVALTNKKLADELRIWISSKERTVFSGKHVEVFSGEKGISEVASYDGSEIVISAIVGAAGLLPTLSAIRAHKDIGLANKETLVMAGTLVMNEAVSNNVKILPVDSEHSAIFQCLEGKNKNDVKRLILTASGGPFFGKNSADLSDVTKGDALQHPNWKMGNKITIDSATLMNKGLEVIEAHHLFGFSAERISVLIHPQSIIHSMVEFNDSGIIAQLSVPDMKGPIAYALSYPERLNNVLTRCNLEEIGTLTFHKHDNESFPCLQLAYNALNEGGTMPAVINAANEVLVTMFLDNTIKFNHIPAIIDKVMTEHNTLPANEIEIIFESDRWARERVNQIVKEQQ